MATNSRTYAPATGAPDISARGPHPGPSPRRHLGSMVRDIAHAGPLGWIALVVALILAIPVGTVVFNLLQPPSPLWPHLAATVLPNYLANTAWLVLGVGLGTIIIGTTVAWLVTMYRFPGRPLFEWALVLPLAVPAYVMAYAYTDFLQFTGPVQTLLRDVTGWGPRDYWFPPIHSVGGAAAMLTLVLYPYVYLLARAAFLTQSVCALEVSRTLGCGPWSSFFRVALPLARPAIVGGAVLALMETLADFGTVSYFGVQTFTTGIYRAWFSMGDQIAAAQLSAGLLGIVILLIALERISRGARRFHHTTSRYKALPDLPLHGWRAIAAIAVCATPITLGFVVPAAVLVSLAHSAGVDPLDARYLGLARNSFVLAGVTAAAAAVLATVMAYAVRLAPTSLTRAAKSTAGLGYAVPGSVIAVGILMPFAWLDNAVDAWTRETFGISVGLVLTGSIAALVLAYLVRFLAVALQSVDAGMSRITPSMDGAARALGRGPTGTLVEVHAPLMVGSLMTAALIVFVDVMKELPATLLMRPFDFDTLAVVAHNFASDERLAEAAIPSLMIVAVGLLPVVLLSRAVARSRPGRTHLPRVAPATEWSALETPVPLPSLAHGTSDEEPAKAA